MRYTVIIPIYNAEEKIGRALESIQKQSEKDLEIICINDGSKDNSADIVKDYAEKDKRIRLYNQQNQGAAVARNFALDLAQGEYIAFLDADDAYGDIQALEKIYEVAQANDAEICMAKIYSVTSGKRKSVDKINDMIGQRAKFQFEDFQYDFFFHTYVYKREFLNENGIRFPVRKIYEDPLFLINAMAKASYIYCVDVEYYIYFWEKKTESISLETVEELLDGLFEVMKVTIDRDCFILKDEILNRVNTIYSEILWQYVTNPVVLNKLIQLNNFYNKERFEILILKELIKYGWNPELRFIMKLDKLKRLSVRDEQIVLYAAGGAGTDFMELNQKCKEVNLVAWIDEKKCGEKINGILIKDVGCLKNIRFDKIIVAIRDNQIYDSIVIMLLEMGIEADKILRWK